MPYQKLLAFANEQGIVLLENEPLCDHTSFRIGGPARLFAMPKTAAQLAHLLDFAARKVVIKASLWNFAARKQLGQSKSIISFFCKETFRLLQNQFLFTHVFIIGRGFCAVNPPEDNPSMLLL